YFIVSGWVKVRHLRGENDVTLAILGRGDFFGEMAILDESPRSTDIVAMSNVRLLTISAQRFIQTLFKDPQLHHRMLQLMVRRLRQSNVRLQNRYQPPAVNLVNTLVGLADNYGEITEKGTEIYNISYQDLADITDISVEDTTKIMEKLESKGWIKTDPEQQTMRLMNIKPLTQLVRRSSS
ncbi:MAG: Crp/Fnr family transcriptional regulator, partial [Moorea sp. SIO3I7]|nr:Crp/Fnr family transcriptional regulator [Moorena sp. SIO3I7]